MPPFAIAFQGILKGILNGFFDGVVARRGRLREGIPTSESRAEHAASPRQKQLF